MAKPLTDSPKVLSQKAQGLIDLLNKGPETYMEVIKGTQVFHEGDGYDGPYPIFARPCPTVPRHGFVDSRLVNSKTELEAIFPEIKAANEPIEILLCPFIKAEWSAIATPNSFSIGLSNDGATSGKSKLLATSFPIEMLAGDAKVDGTPYVEMVWGGLTDFSDPALHVVQLRNGPEVPLHKDVIWEKMTVKTVIKADGQDLLAWEEIINSVNGGTVVWLNGFGMSSHYAVHAINKKIPLISSHEPKVGETFEPSGEYIPNQNDWERMVFYLTKALQQSTISSKDDIVPVMAGIHHLGLWKNFTDAECMYLAKALVGLPRITFSLGMGEMRHWDGAGPGGHKGEPLPTVFANLGLKSAKHRESCYKAADKFDSQKVVRLLPHLIKGFRDYTWSSSYGGMKWSVGIEFAYNLMRAQINFLNTPGPKFWGEMTDWANKLAYAVHNGGRYHNKVIDEATMNRIAHWPGHVLPSPMTHNILFKQFDSQMVQPKKIAAHLLKAVDPSITYGKASKALDETPMLPKPGQFPWGGNTYKNKGFKSLKTLANPFVPNQGYVTWETMAKTLVKAQYKYNDIMGQKIHIQVKCDKAPVWMKHPECDPKPYGFTIEAKINKLDAGLLLKLSKGNADNQEPSFASAAVPYFPICAIEFTDNKLYLTIDSPADPVNMHKFKVDF